MQTLGEAFINLNPTSESHLWVVSSAPTEEGVVIFNFTKAKPGFDSTCTIYPEEHPFVTEPTIVFYRKGRLLTPAAEETMRNMNCFVMKEPVTPALLRKIQLGALASRYTTLKYQRLVELSLIPE